jgi:plasmid replication initiation protein
MKTIEINMSTTKDSLIVISNSIANARYSFSLPTQKMLLYLVSKITYEERKQGVFFNEVILPLEELYHLLKVSGREKSKDLKGLLKNCVSELGKNNIRWSQFDERGKEEWVEFPWFTLAKISENTGKFTFKFNAELSKYLLPSVSYYKSYVEEYLHLSSSHAISLYTLFRANEFQYNIQEYYIDKLKEKLGVEKKYPRWGDFKDYVLDPSISQLNKETNYFFTYEAKRIGRSIGKVEIRVINKKEKEEFSVFLSEKIQSFLKEKKADSNIRKRFEMVKYEYEAKENIIYIDYKDEVSKTKIVEYYKSKQLEGEHPLKRFLDGAIKDNQDFQKFLKTLFRKGVQVMYGEKK